MNHPHESQAAAMARAGELTDGEQLRECINSGQVSAAQVVAHAENGEVVSQSIDQTEWETCVQLRWATHALYLVRNKLRAIGLKKDDTAMVNLSAAENAIAAALRVNFAPAALQKPALHEPVSDQETIDAIRSHHLKVTTESMIDMRRALESFLQGRANPAQEEITDDEFLLQLSRNTLSNVKTAIAKLQELGDKEPIPEQWWAVVSSALYIAAIRASKGEKT